MSGWLPAPPTDRRLIWAAIVVLVASVPFDWWPLMQHFQVLQDGRDALEPLINKTNFGVLRFIHFLSLAYLWHTSPLVRVARYLVGPVVKVVCKVGQQSLGIFIAGLVLSFLAATFLNVAGVTYLTVLVANLGGFAIMIAIAYAVAWFKAAPWAKKPVADTSRHQFAPPVAEPTVLAKSGWAERPTPAE